MSMISENSYLENAKIEHDEKMMLAKTDASSMSELSNISDNENSNNFYCERRELKFEAQGWHSSHAKLGKHNESSKGLQHGAGVFLHSSLNDRVTLSSRHIRSKSEFDYENDAEIDLNRNELKRDRDTRQILFRENLKTHVKELFDLGVNSKIG